MSARFAIIALALGLTVAPAGLRAATPSASVQTLVATAEQRLHTWRAATLAVAQSRVRQSELARRIDALKREGRGGAELQRLLEASVVADRGLEAALSKAAEARADVERAIQAGVARVDREIRALVPKLKAGPIGERRAAARRINALRAERQRLREAASALDAARARPKRDWARYEVEVEPLDGPAELEEKADFVEDTRDKLAKKRRAIAQLLEEAKQEQRIARAARDFDTYVSAFDEETRTERVIRGGAANGPQAAGDLAGAPETPSRGSGSPTTDAPNFGNDGRGGGVDPATPPMNESGNDGFSQTPDASDKLGVGQTPSGPTVGTPSASPSPVGRDINADVLINLRVSELAAQDLDLATLLRLVEELEQLDGYLADQASTIRARAKTLEADEAEDLRK